MYRKKLRRRLTVLLYVLVCLSILLSPAQAAVSHRVSEDASTKGIGSGSGPVPLPQGTRHASLQAGSIAIQNNNFEGNQDYGLNSDVPINAENNWWGDASGPTHASNPDGNGDSVSGNVDFDPWLPSAVDIGIPYSPSPEPGTITLSQNSFEDNGTYGVQSSIPLNAENNWWGHPSGPYHSTLNPDGQGDNVSDNVDFDPWLTTPPAPPATNSVFGHVRDGNGDPIPGVTVSTVAGHSATTDATGAYTISSLAPGTYTLTPNKSGYIFSPASHTVTVPPDATGKDFTGSQTGVDLTIIGLEVTQAIQHFNPGDPQAPDNNRIPLVEDKPTIVRMYVDIGEGATEAPWGVTGVLTVTYSGGTVVCTPMEPHTMIRPPLASELDRAKPKHTLNFLLPREVLTGTITLKAEVNHDCTVPETDCGNNKWADSFEFQSPKRLNIAYVPITCVYPWPTYLTTSPTERIHRADSWLRKIYPLAHIDYVPAPGLLWSNCPVTCGEDSATGLMAELSRLDFMQSPGTDQLVGFLGELELSRTRGCAPLGGGCYQRGSGCEITCPEPVHVSLVSDQAGLIQTIVAHEIGHNYRLCHPGQTIEIPGIPGCDLCETGYARPPEGIIGEVGWDPLDLTRGVKSSQLHDIMVPGATVESSWISTFTYKHLHNWFEPTVQNTAPARADSQDCLLITGYVNSEGTGGLYPTYRYPCSDLVDSSDQGEYSLEVVDQDETTLYAYRFNVFGPQGCYEESTQTSLVAATLPDLPDMAAFQLKHGETLLAEQRVSPHTPVVTVTAPADAEVVSGVYTVTWTASDADEDDLTYAVLYSPDNGASWEPLATSIIETFYTLDTNWVAGGYNARVRVLATDGLNTASDETDGTFAVLKKAPSAYITQPEDGAHFLPGEPIILIGRGYDPEDGTLGDTALVWTSSISGTLGPGTWLQLDYGLSAGTHVITVSAEDSDGNEAATSIQIFVGYRLFLPLVLRGHDSSVNHPPNTPSTPSPSDGARNQNVNANLDWAGGDLDGNSVAYYDVYFEVSDSTPDVLICNDVASPSCDPGTLNHGTHYYWQVVASGEHGFVLPITK